MARRQKLRPMFLAKCMAIWSAVRSFLDSLACVLIFGGLIGGTYWYVVEDKNTAVGSTAFLTIAFTVFAVVRLAGDIEYNLADLRNFPEDWGVAPYRDNDRRIDKGDHRDILVEGKKPREV